MATNKNPKLNNKLTGLSLFFGGIALIAIGLFIAGIFFGLIFLCLGIGITYTGTRLYKEKKETGTEFIGMLMVPFAVIGIAITCIVIYALINIIGHMANTQLQTATNIAINQLTNQGNVKEAGTLRNITKNMDCGFTLNCS